MKKPERYYGAFLAGYVVSLAWYGLSWNSPFSQADNILIKEYLPTNGLSLSVLLKNIEIGTHTLDGRATSASTLYIMAYRGDTS
jgi:hypothetical protein